MKLRETGKLPRRKAMAKFVIYLQPLEEGGYMATVPALPGCVTWGDTRKETLHRVTEAIEGYIASLKKHGEEIPPGIEQATVDTVEVALV